MKVMQTFQPVRIKIKITYEKSSFMRKPTLITVLPSYRMSRIKKCLIKNLTLHNAHVKLTGNVLIIIVYCLFIAFNKCISLNS